MGMVYGNRSMILHGHGGQIYEKWLGKTIQSHGQLRSGKDGLQTMIFRGRAVNILGMGISQSGKKTRRRDSTSMSSSSCVGKLSVGKRRSWFFKTKLCGILCQTCRHLISHVLDVHECLSCFCKSYPPGNKHIPPWEKENHLQNGLFRRYLSS